MKIDNLCYKENMNTENTVINKRGRKKDTNFPMFVTCKITGKQTKVNVTQLKKQLEKSGQSIQEYVEGYISREGKHVLEDRADPTLIAPAINPDIHAAIEADITNRDNFDPEKRKVLLKEIWNKVCQQPPEYYQEKFKLAARNGR